MTKGRRNTKGSLSLTYLSPSHDFPWPSYSCPKSTTSFLSRPASPSPSLLPPSLFSHQHPRYSTHPAPHYVQSHQSNPFVSDPKIHIPTFSRYPCLSCLSIPSSIVRSLQSYSQHRRCDQSMGHYAVHLFRCVRFSESEDGASRRIGIENRGLRLMKVDVSVFLGMMCG